MKMVEFDAASHNCHTSPSCGGIFLGHAAVSEPAQCPFSMASTTEMTLGQASHSEPSPSTASLGGQKSSVSFLNLPCEVRLQIYHWVHLSSPVQQPRLAPWYPNLDPASHTSTQTVIDPNGDDNDDDGRAATATTTTTTTTTRCLGRRRRPFCRMPTALLQTCQQVHAEARVIPFRANGFVFADLLSTGLSSALAFTRGRRAWQRAEMRFVRLEVSARDVVGAGRGGARLADWVQLCGLWSSGLRGLGLVVRTEELGILWEMVEGRTSTDMWIRQGLGRLCGLRELEVELADVNLKWTGEDRAKWCEGLRKMLVSCTGRTELHVVCVPPEDII